MVNINTKTTVQLYNTISQTEFGPGVGAVTFNPKRNQVLFIHGLQNCNELIPYSFSRRTGVSVKIDSPPKTIIFGCKRCNTAFYSRRSSRWTCNKKVDN
ncbi:DUF3748 domain-containing protein [Maribacter sp. ACAM166]|uniref:DUF3748 domain-containing protein n=1 Tax=Maribacter sp. ACAM166 TaxID=2508996 RepID=UPI0010FD57BA|nr:DUF3748 domain-containing protein [Maribacter sp. ACAM166]